MKTVLKSEDYGVAIVTFIVYFGSTVIMLLGLYGIVKYPSAFVLPLGNYCYILLIWCVSAVVNLLVLVNFPGITYLDKGTPTTGKFYVIAGPLLYPKIFCLVLILICEAIPPSAILRLLRRPIDSWHVTAVYNSYMSNKFVSSIERYRKYLRE